MRSTPAKLGLLFGLCSLVAACDNEPLSSTDAGSIAIRGGTGAAAGGSAGATGGSGGLPDGGVVTDSGGGGGAGGAATGGSSGSGGRTGTGGAAGGTGGRMDGGAGDTGGVAGPNQMCGGIAGIRCVDRYFCELPTAVCGTVKDASGICRPRSEVCPDIYTPVCGCDGKTYGNDCDRSAAAVSKKSEGTCAGQPMEGGPGAPCGGFRATPLACKAGLFCELPATTCNRIADIGGTCVEVPAACTLEYAPVCGCDGKTYSNDCARRAAKVSLVSQGACAGDPTGERRCGGIAGLPCPMGFACELPAGSCSSADLFGVCRAVTIACTKEYVPVCGCDGKTYGNDCTRRAAGVTLAHVGACR